MNDQRPQYFIRFCSILKQPEKAHSVRCSSEGSWYKLHKAECRHSLPGWEFVGRSGLVLWDELKIVGITRDMCDIQNVVRCFPANYDDTESPRLKMRDLAPEEIHCCRIFTKRPSNSIRPKLI
jgi:hypothetical protein